MPVSQPLPTPIPKPLPIPIPLRKDAAGNDLLIKSFPFKVSECVLKEAHPDDEDRSSTGIVRGYASTFGNEDRGQDIVAPGAFDRTLMEHRQRSNRPIRLYANHSSANIIGGIPINSATLDSIGLFVEAEIDLNVQKGAELFSLAKKGFISDFSIGFALREAKFNDETGIRTLLDIDLFEVSLVNEPMNQLATVTEVEGDKGNGDKRPGDPNYKPKGNVDMPGQHTVFKNAKGDTITLDENGKVVKELDNVFINEKGEKISIDEDGEVIAINQKSFTVKQVETLKTNADVEELLKEARFSKSARKTLISKIKGFDSSEGRDDSNGGGGRDDQSSQGREDSAEKKSALSMLSDITTLLKPNEDDSDA